MSTDIKLGKDITVRFEESSGLFILTQGGLDRHTMGDHDDVVYLSKEEAYNLVDFVSRHGRVPLPVGGPNVKA